MCKKFLKNNAHIIPKNYYSTGKQPTNSEFLSFEYAYLFLDPKLLNQNNHFPILGRIFIGKTSRPCIIQFWICNICIWTSNCQKQICSVMKFAKVFYFPIQGKNLQRGFSQTQNLELKISEDAVFFLDLLLIQSVVKFVLQQNKLSKILISLFFVKPCKGGP
jgi:hypothetical protein